MLWPVVFSALGLAFAVAFANAANRIDLSTPARMLSLFIISAGYVLAFVGALIAQHCL